MRERSCPYCSEVGSSWRLPALSRASGELRKMLALFPVEVLSTAAVFFGLLGVDEQAALVCCMWFILPIKI
jgi:hypothetical protein